MSPKSVQHFWDNDMRQNKCLARVRMNLSGRDALQAHFGMRLACEPVRAYIGQIVCLADLGFAVSETTTRHLFPNWR